MESDLRRKTFAFSLTSFAATPICQLSEPMVHVIAIFSRAVWHTGVPKEFLKRVIPDYLVRGTDLFSLRLSDLKMATANTTVAVNCERTNIIPIFCQIDRK